MRAVVSAYINCRLNRYYDSAPFTTRRYRLAWNSLPSVEYNQSSNIITFKNDSQIFQILGKERGERARSPDFGDAMMMRMFFELKPPT